MTNHLVPAAVLGLLLLAPLAAAHGMPAARSIDSRVIQDNTDFGDYGGDGGLPPPFIAPALNLLALDLREAYNPAGEPGVWFRTATVTETPEGDHRIDITFSVAGTAHTFDLSTTDHETWTSTTFTYLSNSIPVLDGHPKAVDAFVSYEALGASPGDPIMGVTATSYAGDTEGDTMPGGYNTAVGQIVLPQDGSQTSDYTLAGPAPLLTATTETANLAVATTPAGHEVSIAIESGTTDLEQFVNAELILPDGAAASLSEASVLLGANETRNLTVTLSTLAAGDLQILVTSDLGARAIVTIPLVGGGPSADGNVESGDMGPGDSFQQLFGTIGEFSYHCHPHPWMAGTITVQEAPNGSTPEIHTIEIIEEGEPADWRFTPDTLTINAGDTVVWVNKGEAIHDVRGGFAGHGGHDHSEHHHEAPENGIPGPGLFLVAIAIALAGRRR